MTAANVDNSGNLGEIIGLGDGLVTALAKGDHRALEQRRLVRMFGEPVKPGPSKHLVESGQAGAHGMAELGEGEIGLAVQHPDKIAWSARLVGAQRRADFREREATRRSLAKHALSGEQSHDPVQGVGVRARLCRQVIDAPLAGSHAVGDSEIRHDAQGL